MAMARAIVLPAVLFVGDSNAQFVAGDNPANPAVHVDRSVLSFPDGATESAAVSCEFQMPSDYAGGTLTAKVLYYAESATSGDFDLEVYVESKTPDADTLDMEAASSWDAANQADLTASGTAGDPLTADVTLTNKDSVAAGDTVRIGLRRDSDDATDDDASGALFVAWISITES